MWPPKELGITLAARQSKNTAHLYKKEGDGYGYMIVDYMEIDKYLDEGFKRTPMECDDEEVSNIQPKTQDLKVKIDHLETKIKEKEKELTK
jgi:hypothetical protein